MFVNVPVALAVLLLAPFAVPESRDHEAPRALDVPGAAVATLGLTSLIYAVSEVPEAGWPSPVTVGFGTAGALLLALFVAVEDRSAAPLVPLGALRERAVVVPNAAIALQSMVGVAWLYVLTLYFQEALGHGPPVRRSPLRPHDRGLHNRRARRRTAHDPPRGEAHRIGGLVLVGAGLLLMALMPEGGGLPFMLAGMVVGEFGFMLSDIPLTIAATGGTSEGWPRA